MIGTLEDAWLWYRGVADLTGWMTRLGKRYWDDPAVAPLLALDDHLRHVEREKIEDRARRPHALKELHEALRHGSFAKVLEAYKVRNPDLVEEVSQVRRYRNWVTHRRLAALPGADVPCDAAFAAP